MFSYQKLTNVAERDEEDEELVPARNKVITNGSRGWRWGRSRWRRPRVRVAGLIRRVVRRKAAAVQTAVGLSLKKVMVRLKEGRPYVGELFSGNYLFMQVNPSVAMPYLDKSLIPSTRFHQASTITPKIAY